jgi:hypothetical protein
MITLFIRHKRPTMLNNLPFQSESLLRNLKITGFQVEIRFGFDPKAMPKKDSGKESCLQWTSIANPAQYSSSRLI